MGLSGDSRDELQSRLYSDAYDRSVAWRAQIVLWDDEGYSAAEIARMAKTTKPTVYKWIERYAECGIAGLESRKSTGRPRSISGEVRSRILALSRESPPESTGLTHWSSMEMAKYLERHEGFRCRTTLCLCCGGNTVCSRIGRALSSCRMIQISR